MAVAVADLDGVPVDVVPAVGVEVRCRARVDAGVAVAVRLAIGIETVVVGEGEESVLVIPASDHLVDDESVGFHDVDRIECCSLRGEVA